MTPNQYYKSHKKAHIEAVCANAGTTFGNFQQIAIANGSVSAQMAKRLSVASGYEMSITEILFPDESGLHVNLNA